jgi:hypothetical protein
MPLFVWLACSSRTGLSANIFGGAQFGYECFRKTERCGRWGSLKSLLMSAEEEEAMGEGHYICLIDLINSYSDAGMAHADLRSSYM